MSIKPTRLTLKERRYIRRSAEAGFPESKKKKAQIARDAGFKAPYQAVQRIESNPRIHSIVQREMDRQGLSLEFTVKKHKQLMDCKHPFRPKQDDNTVQLQAMKEAYKLQEAYPDTKIQIDKRVAHYEVPLEAYRRAEEVTGEKIIDLVPEEEDEDVGFVEAL